MRRLLCLSLLLLIGGVGHPSAFAGDFEFLRGDVNGDGLVHPLMDAHALLEFITAGGSPPPCMEAADVDDNGTVHGLIDSIALFQWAYTGGDAPPDPGPDSCGLDPNNDSPDCDTAPACSPSSESPETDSDYLFALSAGYGSVGEDAVVTLSFTNDGDPVAGLETGICHDAELVSINEESFVRLDDLNATFVATESHDTNGWAFGMLLDVHAGQTIDGDGEEVALVEVSYSVDAEGESNLEFCGVGSTHVAEPRALLTSGALVLPELVGSSIAAASFLRGDVDGNGQVAALIDAVALLEWGFAAAAAPVCADAADVDDDGVNFPLLDTIYLLSWGFTAGAEPPSPGPLECGVDPTEDSVSCAGVAPGCE